ncbi:phosphotransferase family protein, partial [Rickettsiella grylli]
YFQTVKSIFNKKDYKILKKLTGIQNFLKKSNTLKFPSHGDLHHFNIIETNGTMQLIDWELSSQEDPAYDISRLFCVTEFSYEQRQFFLSIYKNAYNIIVSEYDIKKLINRIFLHESLNYFSIIIQSRYMMSFFPVDKQKFLIETIQNFSVKDKLICY